MDRWLSETRILGVPDGFEWEGDERDEAVAGPRVLLRSGLELAEGCLVASVDSATGKWLRELSHPRARILRSEVLSRDEVSALVESVFEGTDREGWVRALMEVSGGWLESLQFAIEVASELQLPRPDSQRWRVRTARRFGFRGFRSSALHRS